MKTIGILGGMGPEATAHFLNLIIKYTPAKVDQDHIPIIVWNNPKIPDRTEFILGKGESPLPHLIDGALMLQKAGANFLVMPCVTGHYFYEDILKTVKIPLLNIIEEIVKYRKHHMPKVKKIGIISSTGTIKAGLFKKFFEKEKIKLVIPGKTVQKNLVTEAIYGKKGIKAGYKRRPKKLLVEAGSILVKNGAEALISGCTESAIVLKENDFSVPLLNPLEILAKASIKFSAEY